MFSIFGIYTSFEKAPEHVLSAVAVTDCLLYSWSLDELSTMATHMAPAGATEGPASWAPRPPAAGLRQDRGCWSMRLEARWQRRRSPAC